MKKGENMKKFFCVLCGICLFYMGYAQEKEVKADRQSEEDASWAILTTDTKPKEAAVEVEINGTGNGR